MYKNILSGILGIIALSGCEDVATKVKMPPAEKKIVVQCFISPDDTSIVAMVSWSKPVIGTKQSADPEFINNARVEISDGVKTEILLWNSTSRMYELPTLLFDIEAGKKYFLTVSLIDGKKVTANCDVPLTQNTTLVFNHADTTTDSWGEESVNCSFKYKDHETAVVNYFRLHGRAVYSSPYEDYYVAGVFKQDSELGADNIFKFSVYDYPFPTEKVKAWLINCDYNYFQYHKTLQGAQDNFGIFTEPSIVYSNIEGGLGCFGAYNSYEVEVDL